VSAKSSAQPVQRLGRFEVVLNLGAGGGGRVRLVRDPRQGGALCALKVGAPAEGHETQKDFDAQVAASNLLAEARVLGAILHPGLPRLFDVGRFADGTTWLLMEHVAPDAAPPDPARFAAGALDAVACLHRHGWLHHDLKPANVLAGERGRVVVVDFGLASREGEDVSARGTLPFVAPEVLAGARPDQRSDLWSLGAGLLARFGTRTFAPNATTTSTAVRSRTTRRPHGWCSGHAASIQCAPCGSSARPSPEIAPSIEITQPAGALTRKTPRGAAETSARARCSCSIARGGKRAGSSTRDGSMRAAISRSSHARAGSPSWMRASPR
jgi:serine/threonine protein kinase